MNAPSIESEAMTAMIVSRPVHFDPLGSFHLTEPSRNVPSMESEAMTAMRMIVRAGLRN
jgi:hypothetical protein